MPVIASGDREIDINTLRSAYILLTNDPIPTGGAGYVLNNIAMKVFAVLPPCLENIMPSANDFQGYLGEDQFIGLELYARTRTRIIHCGSFHSNGHTTGQYNHENKTWDYSYFDHAISFHRVSPTWIYTNKLTVLREHYNLEE